MCITMHGSENVKFGGKNNNWLVTFYAVEFLLILGV